MENGSQVFVHLFCFLSRELVYQYISKYVIYLVVDFFLTPCQGQSFILLHQIPVGMWGSDLWLGETYKYFTRQIRECWEQYSQLIEDHGDVLQLYSFLPGLFQPGDPPVHVCHRVRASYHFNGVREPGRVWSLRYCELGAIKERPWHVETLESMPEQVDSVS